MNMMKWARIIPIAMVIMPISYACAQTGPGIAYQGLALTTVNINGTAVTKPITSAHVIVCPSVNTSCITANGSQIFSDVGLSQPVTNPLVADKYGNFTFYALPGQYKYTIYTSTMTPIATYPLTLLSAGSGDISPTVVAGVRYVYPTPGLDFGTVVNNAFASCGIFDCTVIKKATIEPVKYAVTIHSPSHHGASFEGNNGTLEYTPTGGDAWVVDPYNGNDPSGEIRNITFDETGYLPTNVIHQLPRIFFSYKNVTVRNAVASTALLMDNTVVTGTGDGGDGSGNYWPSGQFPAYSERTQIDGSFTNNAKGIVFKKNGGTDSFARTVIHAYCFAQGTQACVSAEDNSFVYGSEFYIHMNGGNGASRVVQAINGGGIRAEGFIEGETSGYALYQDATGNIGFDGGVQVIASLGSYNGGVSSAQLNRSLQGQLWQAGTFNLGVAQARNSKWLLNQDSVDYWTALAFGTEQRGNFTIHTRVTSDADPESDGTGYDSVFHADSRGFVSIGPKYEVSGPNNAYNNHLSGAPFEMSVPMAQYAPIGLNGSTYRFWQINTTAKRFETIHRGYDTPGQPGYPDCQIYKDSGGGADIIGECETPISSTMHYTNKNIGGQYTAGSFSTGQASAVGTTCTVGGYVTVTIDGVSRKLAYCN